MESLATLKQPSSTKGTGQKAVDAFFQEHAGYWKDVYQADTLSALVYQERREVVLAMVDKLQLPSGSRALDIGCGAGLTAVALGKRGFLVNAADTVDDMVDLARQAVTAAGLHPSVETSPANICELNFPSQHFELVVAIGVLPWLDDPVRALWEVCRVTRSKGFVILTADHSWCLNQMLDPLCFPGLRPIRWQIADMLEKFSIWSRPKPRQHRHSIKQIDALISQAGLHKLEGRTLGFGHFTFFKQNLLQEPAGIKIHQKLQALADFQLPGLRSLGAEYVVLAMKP